jgi:hypothetical protein
MLSAEYESGGVIVLPESRHKYLFERLGDHDFQQLICALLSYQFSGFVPMALRQSDGGRDGLLKTEPGRALIYQVKWSADGRLKDPVSTLDAIVKKEENNLRDLAQQGVRRYVLVTNVPSTSKPGRGTYDRLDRKLEEYSKKFGFEQISCMWRESINAWVDNSPTETKWAYAEMLAGWDLVRYLVAEEVGAARDKGLRDLVRKVAATQWGEDEVVKFSQAEVDSEKIVDLFVDVTAEKINSIVRPGVPVPNPFAVGGAAKYLLTRPSVFTLVRGAPGQGKSTLSQYVCQAHRTPFIPEKLKVEGLNEPAEPRFPIRMDLSNYALWLAGADPWNADEGLKRAKKPKPSGNQATIECFIADLMTYASGGIPTDAKAVHELFARVPSLVVLDGLDEVGSHAVRAKVVQAIDQFARRADTYTVPPKIIVTTRPSAGELPEPSPQMFEALALNPLTLEQRNDYLRKWCAVRGIRSTEGRALRTAFREKSKEQYIGELAGNPMQLTILLDLLHQQGAATPTQRTDLYDHYVDLLLAREANKHPDAVKKHKDELLEIVPFIGWYLQAHTEESQINGRMTVNDLKAAMRHFQRTYGRSEDVVDKLFEGVTDRLWALTSKIEGTYEFEVLSLREYFAGRFLYQNAGEDNAHFDRTTVLQELLRRPYWLNTVRFYGGNAKGSGIYVLAAGMEEELARPTTAAASIASWTLVTDGVFLRRPLQGRSVLSALCSDQGLHVLLPALDRREITPLPELPQVVGSEDEDPTWLRLTAAITTDPNAPQNRHRVRALRELLNQRTRFATWWVEHVTKAAGTAAQNDWLRLAAGWEAAAGVPLDLVDADLTGGAAELWLNTGAVPTAGGAFEAELLRRVLDGECPTVTSTRSLPAQVATALSPTQYFTASPNSFVEINARWKRRRAEAISDLRKAGSPFAMVAGERIFKAGQKGSTFPWANSATALFDAVGRTWLASEIAVIGAASEQNLGYVKHPTRSAFGPDAHPAELLAQTRQHATDVSWWQRQLSTTEDDLAKAEWALAIWAVAAGQVVDALFLEWQTIVNALPASRRGVLLDAAGRIARSGSLRTRRVSVTSTNTDVSELIAMRTGASKPIKGGVVMVARRAATVSASETTLLSTARAGGWFKVDSVASYR